MITIYTSGGMNRSLDITKEERYISTFKHNNNTCKSWFLTDPNSGLDKQWITKWINQLIETPIVRVTTAWASKISNIELNHNTFFGKIFPTQHSTNYLNQYTIYSQLPFIKMCPRFQSFIFGNVLSLIQSIFSFLI